MGDILTDKPAAENLIEDIIGRDAYLELCAWCGGTNYYVPSDAENFQGLELERAIGRPRARRLVEWAGGSVIYVPNRFAAALLNRRDQIMALRKTGKTVQEISRAYRYVGSYTERQIWRVINTPREEILHGTPDSQQNLDLFA